MKRKIDSFRLASFIITCICTILGIALFFILPEKIAIQWNAGGVSNTVNKIYILLFPALSVVFVLWGKLFINSIFIRYFSNMNDRLALYITMFIEIIFLTCEIYTALYAYGLRLTISAILIFELIIGVVQGIKIARKR